MEGTGRWQLSLFKEPPSGPRFLAAVPRRLKLQFGVFAPALGVGRTRAALWERSYPRCPFWERACTWTWRTPHRGALARLACRVWQAWLVGVLAAFLAVVVLTRESTRWLPIFHATWVQDGCRFFAGRRIEVLFSVGCMMSRVSHGCWWSPAGSPTARLGPSHLSYTVWMRMQSQEVPAFPSRRRGRRP